MRSNSFFVAKDEVWLFDLCFPLPDEDFIFVVCNNQVRVIFTKIEDPSLLYMKKYDRLIVFSSPFPEKYLIVFIHKSNIPIMIKSDYLNVLICLKRIFIDITT